MTLLVSAALLVLGCSLFVYGLTRRTDRRIAAYERRLELANEAYQAAIRATVDRAMDALDVSPGLPTSSIDPAWFDAHLAEAVAVTGHGAVKTGSGTACWTYERGRC